MSQVDFTVCGLRLFPTRKTLPEPAAPRPLSQREKGVGDRHNHPLHRYLQWL